MLKLWTRFIDGLPEWLFSPQPKQQLQPPDPEDERFGERIEIYEEFVSRQKAFHDETSKTIKRVFFTLVGTCLFCVVTLTGSSDAELLTPTATVQLPILNYDINFHAFLVVGPVVLIALIIYLHIFVAQHRMTVIEEKARQPMLPNFDSWTAKLLIAVIFYWLVPLTLSVFVWKAWPRPQGSIFMVVAFVITAALTLLQMRRAPRDLRPWVLPLLAVTCGLYFAGTMMVAKDRVLNLFKADLSQKDLRYTNLSAANLEEANLSESILLAANMKGANLRKANLAGVELRWAVLSNAALSHADLSGADLSDADLSQAALRSSNLSGAILPGAILTGAKLPRANLSGANLDGAQLPEADLKAANMSNITLKKANLSGADLSQANLSNAVMVGALLSSALLYDTDFSGADLRGANFTQYNLDNACGDDNTKLPEGVVIKNCADRSK